MITVEQRIDEALRSLIATRAGVRAATIGDPPEKYEQRGLPAAWIETEEVSRANFAVGRHVQITRSFEIKLVFVPEGNIATAGETWLGRLEGVVMKNGGLLIDQDGMRLGSLSITNRLKGEAVGSAGKLGGAQLTGEIKFVRLRDDPTRRNADAVAA